MKFFSSAAVLTVPLTFALCFADPQAGSGAYVIKDQYGTTPSGVPIDQYTLVNGNGFEVTIITYGGIITSVRNSVQGMPNIVLGFDNLSDYETKNSPHFGGIIGRYGNRIANGVFTLNGVTYCLDANNGANSLHGGFSGFDSKVWTMTSMISDGTQAGIQLHYMSHAGEGWTGTAPNPNCPANAVNGFPGDLDTYVTYTLNSQNEITIQYQATTNAPTVVNLTNHTYWNLAGEGSGTIYNHVVTLNANYVTPVASDMIPTGTLQPVQGTALDFRAPKRVSTDIRADNQQIAYGNGFDFNWVLNPAGSGLTWAATVIEPASHRVLTVSTDQPAIQFYTGNFLDGSLYGPRKRAYRQSDGLALETQHYPDSPNHVNFPTTVLLPGQTYQTTTVYKIDIN